jgi:hypothetical protein
MSLIFEFLTLKIPNKFVHKVHKNENGQFCYKIKIPRFKPRRGTKENAEKYLIGDKVLENGEIFFEVPDTGIGTGKGKIKMGDGIHDYVDLPYFIE